MMTDAIKLILFLVAGLTSVAALANDAPPSSPSVDEIVRRLESNEQALESLQATYLCIDTFNYMKPGTELPRGNMIEDDAVSMTRRGEVAWEMTSSGQGRTEAHFQKTNVRVDGEKIVREWIYNSVFDGTSGRYRITSSRSDGSPLGVLRGTTETLGGAASTPFDITSQHQGIPISKLLVDGRASVVGNDRREERPVAILEVQPIVKPKYASQHRFWIDYGRGTVVRRQTFMRYGEDIPWALHYQVDSRQYSEYSPGIWLPEMIDIENYIVTRAGQEFLSSKEHYKVSNWIVNAKIDPARFE